MYAYNKKRQRPSIAYKEVNSLGLQFSLQANASAVNERPGGKSAQPPHTDFRLTVKKMPSSPLIRVRKNSESSQEEAHSTEHNSDLRLGREHSHGHRSAFQHDYPSSQHSLPSSRRYSQPVPGDPQEPSLSASYGGHSDHRTPRHRQVHHPAPAFATQLTDLDPSNLRQPTPPRDEMPPVFTHHPHPHPHPQHHRPHSQGATRLIQSAGSAQSRQVKPTSYVPDETHSPENETSDLGSPNQPSVRPQNSGDRVLFTESPSVPGVPVVYRTPEERSLNPDRLNLDRRRLTVCPILEGEDHLRLLNFQHNGIRRIERLATLRRLIFLDLYDNHIEAISGLETLRSLRVLMLGKNRIQKIENLQNLAKLDVLDLHGNRITKVENLDHLQELRVLNLAGNEICTVENLCGMDSLTELNLRRNKISSVTDVDTLPSLQRLFLSFNLITSFDDVACLSDSTSLTEVSLDGNPFCQDMSYKPTVIRNMNYLKQLDMKKITEEERKAAMAVIKKEEQKKRELNRIAVLREKRRLAIKNAARQWEASKSTAMAKTSRLQPRPIYGGGERGGESDPTTPIDSRPGSSEAGSERVHSVDLLEDERNSSRPSTRSDSRTRKAPTPDLLANITDEVCHLAELEGDTLHLYGPGSLEALDKNWGVQAAGSITTIAINFIDFNLIARHLHKIRIRFPNVSNINLGECNITNLVQLNALASLRRLESLTVSAEGNPITSYVLWKHYLLYRLAHLTVKKINGQPVLPTDQLRAEKYFGTLSKLTAEELSNSHLQVLLGDTRRRVSQPLTEAELKAKRQLASDQPTTAENAGKAGLVYLPEESLNILQQERLSKTDMVSSYVQQLTTEAIEADRKMVRLAQVWSRIFITMVYKALLEMSDVESYQQRALKAFKNS